MGNVSPKNQGNQMNKLNTFKKEDQRPMIERFQNNTRPDPRLVAAMTRHPTTHSDSRAEDGLSRGSFRQQGREQSNFIQRIQQL